jgi:DNA invertase Pin-like site-specific DNA recombinase
MRMTKSSAESGGKAARRTRATAWAVYARTAVEGRRDGGTCDEQVREAREALGGRRRILVFADAGASGLHAGRPGLRRLLAQARQGAFTRLLVRDLARLARSWSLLHAILGRLRDAGVQVMTFDEVRTHA